MDTDNTDNTPAPAPDPAPHDNELDALRAHNAKLLAELKETKRKAGELATQVETAAADLQASRTELHRLQLDVPVEAMLQKITMNRPTKVMRFLLESNGYAFTLEDGKVVLRNRDGNIPKINDREIEFTESDLRDYLGDHAPERNEFNTAIWVKMPSGGGSSGNWGNVSLTPTAKAPAAPQPQQFGIK